jgi:hypothetical protein
MMIAAFSRASIHDDRGLLARLRSDAQRVLDILDRRFARHIARVFEAVSISTNATEGTEDFGAVSEMRDHCILHCDVTAATRRP